MRNVPSKPRKGNGWTVLATRVCGRLNQVSRRDNLRTMQRKLKLRKQKSRPYRPSNIALGIIRPYISVLAKAEEFDITNESINIKFRVSPETRKALRPFK